MKAIKISILCCLAVEKFDILLECLLPDTNPVVYPNCIGSGIHQMLKQVNFHRSWLWVDVALIWCYGIQFGERTIHKIFVTWVIFMEAIVSCLNLKPDNWLPYSMPEVFNKSRHGLAGIIIVWAEFKPVLHPKIFWSRIESPTLWLVALSKYFLEFISI